MVIARLLKTALRSLGALIEPGLLIAGAALIAYGAWQVYAPAGPIIGGAILIAGVILNARGNFRGSR